MVACPYNSLIQESESGRWEFKASLSQENKTKRAGKVAQLQRALPSKESMGLDFSTHETELRQRQTENYGNFQFRKKKNAQGETLPQRIKPESSRRSQTPFSGLCLCVLVHPHTCVHSTFTHEYILKISKPQNNKILNQLYKKVNELVTILKGWTVLENECVSDYCCVIYCLQS